MPADPAGFLLISLFWLLVALTPLVYLQQRLHMEIVAVFFLATRQLNLSLIFFSILFFPGVLLHELSHWIMARILQVRTGKIWLIPERTPEGNLRMGYVETQPSDIVRDALIGVAPLLAGGAFVGFSGISLLNLDAIWIAMSGGEAGRLAAAVQAMYARPDFWLWFYLIFVVSSMMLPSKSDRRAWRPLALFAFLLLGLALISGAGDWMLAHLAPLVGRLFSAGAAVFGISALVHGLLLLPVLLLRETLVRLTGQRVV